ncbi:unnamed protein product, partial [Choristocarpus tenellus]
IRGGIEGSIAHLRFYTRALSPIHVRIIYDPGPPETVRVEDQHCYQMCVCLVIISRSAVCRRHLLELKWLSLCFQAFIYGTGRVKQAVARLFREVLPYAQPEVISNLPLYVGHSPSPKREPRSESGSSHNSFITYLLQLIGLSSWSAEAASTAMIRGTENEFVERDGEVAVTLEDLFCKQSVIFRTSTSSLEDGTSKAADTREQGCSAKVSMVLGLLSKPLLSASAVLDMHTVSAELIALLKTLSKTHAWQEVIATEFRKELHGLATFIHGTGMDMFGSSRQENGDASDELRRWETRKSQALVRAEAALQVLGGQIELFHVGVTAEMCGMDTQCTVLSFDPPTSNTHVLVHPVVGAAAAENIQRVRAEELRVVHQSLSSNSIWKALHLSSPAFLNQREGEGTRRPPSSFLMDISIALLHSKPLPRPSLSSSTQSMVDDDLVYRELLLAKCRTKCANILHCLSKEEDWAKQVIENAALFSKILHTAVIPDSATRSLGLDTMEKKAANIQSRLHQMCGTPGSLDIIRGKVAELISHKTGNLVSGNLGSQKNSDLMSFSRLHDSHHHQVNSGEVVCRNNLSCPFCPEVGMSPSDVVEHVLQKHSTDMQKVPCPVCVAERGDSTVHDLPTHLELFHFNSNAYNGHALSRVGFVPSYSCQYHGETARSDIDIPSDLVEQLMVIGFPEEWCIMALRENNNDVVNASAWIVDHLDMLSTLHNLEPPDPSIGSDGNIGTSLGCRSPINQRMWVEDDCKRDSENHQHGQGPANDGEEAADVEDSESAEGEEMGAEPDIEGQHEVDDEDEVEEEDEDGIFDSEEDESKEDIGMLYVRHHGEDHQRFIETSSAVNSPLENQQLNEVEDNEFEEGHILSISADSYFPLESPHVNCSGKSASLHISPINAEIAGMELSQLTEAWLQTEMSLTIRYCRSVIVNALVHWPASKAMYTSSFGSPSLVVQLVKAVVFYGGDVPVDVVKEPHDGLLCPLPNGAYPPNMLSVFGPWILHLLRVEQDEANDSHTETGVGTRSPGSHGQEPERLSTLLVACCLDELDMAAEPFSSTPWGSARSESAFRGKANIELLQWLIDLLFSAGSIDMCTENAFSRLSNCLQSTNASIKEVAMYALTCIATKWCEQLTIGSSIEAGTSGEAIACAPGLPSPLAMEDTLQRHIAISSIRSAIGKRMAAERRQVRLFFTRYLQTMAAFFISVCKLQQLITQRRQISSPRKDAALTVKLGDPGGIAVLYCTDSSVALTWSPVRTAASTSRVMYEVQMASRQLGGGNDRSKSFQCVYTGKRLRCKVDNLMPCQVYHFQLRAFHPVAGTTPWSQQISAETEPGVAFRFDPANSGPAIFVDRNELSASFGSNETWSTILGTTPFISGKNYWELHLEKSSMAYLFIGVATRDTELTTFLGGDEYGWGFIGDRALYHKRTKVKAYGERFSQGDTIGVTLNLDRGTLSFSKNGLDLGVAFEGLVGELYPAVAFYSLGQRVSLVRSAFRCPGAGVTLLKSPMSTTPEDLCQVSEAMQAMVFGTGLPRQWISEACAAHGAWVAGNTIRYMTSCGYELQFDTSETACTPFGLRTKGRVQTPRGNATVVGVCNGAAWFHVDGEPGAWFFTLNEILEGRSVGRFIMSLPVEEGPDGDRVGTESGHSKHWALSSLKGEGREDQISLDQREIKRVEEMSGQENKEIVWGPFSEDEFRALADCPKWTPAMDSLVVSALNNYADCQQISVWNIPPKKVLQILDPMRRRLKHLGVCNGGQHSNINDAEVLCRLSLLKAFNHQLISVLPFVDLAEGVQQSGKAQSRTFYWGQASPERGLAVGAASNYKRGLGPLLVCLRGSIFVTTKRQVLHQAVAITTTKAKKAEDEYDYPESLPQVLLNRQKAAAAQESLNTKVCLEASLFSQLYKELHFLETSLLRMGYTHPMDDGQERTFKVKFAGEGVDDYGGPYREIFTQVAAELKTVVALSTDDNLGSLAASYPAREVCMLPILQPTPNSIIDGLGARREKGEQGEGMDFTVFPRVHKQQQLDMYNFLGQLIGIALRSKVPTPWALSRIVWKALVGQAMYQQDLEHLDSSLYMFLQKVQELLWERSSMVAADAKFNESGQGNTTLEAWHGMEATLQELASNGEAVKRAGGVQSQSTTIMEGLAQTTAIAQDRLHQGDTALFAIRDGLASLVPAAVLPLFTWEEMELEACGRQGVDVNLLEANTEYDEDISCTDPHIKRFWRVLRAFDDKDRSQFLRFVWARSRLPLHASSFHQKFKIQAPTGEGVRDDPDSYLPKAHTCFFSINLPKYTSDEIMTEKLTYTMYNCIEMDADFRLADSEMTGW